jgi:DNA-binding transcriptional LysR family regulator
VAPPAQAASADRIAGNRLNLTRLRYFVAVAQELHFGRAARRLGISQPPLSLHIKALEQQIGVELFTRANRKVFLTAPGRILHQQAARLLDHARRVDQVMRGVGVGEFGELFIGCVPSVIYDVLPSILIRFRAQHPQVHLVLKEAHTMDVMDEVGDGRLDAGIVWGNFSDPSIGTQLIRREQFSAVIPIGHPLSRKKVVSLRDLSQEPLILPPRKSSPYHYDHILAAFGNQGLSPRIEYEIPAVLSQIGFVASGFGIAISPGVARRFAKKDVAIVPIADEMPPVLLSLVWSKERDSHACAQLREVTRELFEAKD